MRATAASILLLVLNFIGLGFGPAFVGLMSDMLAPDFGSDSLRIAMLITVAVYAVSISMAYLASRHFVQDLGRVNTGLSGDTSNA